MSTPIHSMKRSYCEDLMELIPGLSSNVDDIVQAQISQSAVSLASHLVSPDRLADTVGYSAKIATSSTNAPKDDRHHDKPSHSTNAQHVKVSVTSSKTDHDILAERTLPKQYDSDWEGLDDCNLTHVLPTCNTARFLDVVECTSPERHSFHSLRHEHWEERVQLEREHMDHDAYFETKKPPKKSERKPRNEWKSPFSKRPSY